MLIYLSRAEYWNSTDNVLGSELKFGDTDWAYVGCAIVYTWYY